MQAGGLPASAHCPLLSCHPLGIVSGCPSGGKCMGAFHLVSDYQPRGDQPQAIESLVAGLKGGHGHQVLLGVTGSGKTFTMANVIAAVDRPALVIAHNKTPVSYTHLTLPTIYSV